MNLHKSLFTVVLLLGAAPIIAAEHSPHTPRSARLAVGLSLEPFPEVAANVAAQLAQLLADTKDLDSLNEEIRDALAQDCRKQHPKHPTQKSQPCNTTGCPSNPSNCRMAAGLTYSQEDGAAGSDTSN